MADISGLYPQPPVANKLLGPMDAMQQNIGVAQGLQSLSQQQLNQAVQHLDITRNAVGSLAALKDVTPADVTNKVQGLVSMGVLPSDRASAFLATMPGDPAQLKPFLMQKLLEVSDHQQQFHAAVGVPSRIDTGPSIQSGTIDTMTGAFRPATVTPKGLTPEGAVSPVPGPPGPGGAPTTMPTGAYAEKTGVAPPGTYTGKGTGSNTMVTGQAPGQAETQKANAEMGIALQQTADESPTRKGMLAQLENDLDRFKAGPGADWEKVAKSWANRNVLPTSMQFDPKAIASQEAFEKQATQLATAQFKAIGGTGTDDKLSAAYKSNPNTVLSQMGNRGIIQLLKGNEDAITAKNQAWQTWKDKYGAGSYDKFTTAFNKVYNPLVFQAQYMNPDEVKGLREKLSDNDRKKFEQGYIIAKQNGWLGGNSASGQ